MAVAVATVEELVATLQRSRLPTVVVEGHNDMTFFRWLEQKLGLSHGNILPCGGRSILFELFHRRAEFKNIPTAFLADKDMWLFGEIPVEFSDIVFTTGYSVENDVYADSCINDLLAPAEMEEFDSVLTELVKWFAFEVEEFRAGRPYEVATRLNSIIPIGTRVLNPHFLATRGFRQPQQSTVTEIRQNARLIVRGKTLEDLWMRILGSEGRNPRHGRSTVFETCVKVNPSRHVRRIVSGIQNKLGGTVNFSLTACHL